jgi:hypothetical protein
MNINFGWWCLPAVLSICSLIFLIFKSQSKKANEFNIVDIFYGGLSELVSLFLILISNLVAWLIYLICKVNLNIH